jgi:hypothetical protein
VPDRGSNNYTTEWHVILERISNPLWRELQIISPLGYHNSSLRDRPSFMIALACSGRLNLIFFAPAAGYNEVRTILGVLPNMV